MGWKMAFDSLRQQLQNVLKTSQHSYEMNIYVLKKAFDVSWQ